MRVGLSKPGDVYNDGFCQADRHDEKPCGGQVVVFEVGGWQTRLCQGHLREVAARGKVIRPRKNQDGA